MSNAFERAWRAMNNRLDLPKVVVIAVTCEWQCPRCGERVETEFANVMKCRTCYLFVTPTELGESK